jgi:phytoene/squalene synthetase
VTPITLNPASTITKAASRQTYYTIRFLVDRDRVDDAFRAYAYFRWVDDVLDAESGSGPEREVFLERQKNLLERCYRGETPRNATIQEQMLVELVQHDPEKNSGLQLYLRNMMQVMDFDAHRRGRLIGQAELNDYTRWLASAVMECIHFFIGHDDYAPRDERRYLAVAAAHMTHMLRDTFDDLRTGYYNIPREVLEENHLGPQDVGSDAYRAWVKSRVQLAHDYFKAGKEYFARVQNVRCRLACFAYIARFEWLLDTIERDGYLLRPQYKERKTAKTGLRMSWLTIASMLHSRGMGTPAQPVASERQGGV